MLQNAQVATLAANRPQVAVQQAPPPPTSTRLVADDGLVNEACLRGVSLQVCNALVTRTHPYTVPYPDWSGNYARLYLLLTTRSQPALVAPRYLVQLHLANCYFLPVLLTSQSQAAIGLLASTLSYLLVKK